MEMRDTFLELNQGYISAAGSARNLAVYTSCFFFAGSGKNSWQMMLTSPDLS